MILGLREHLVADDLRGKFFIGVVKDNKDPLECARIKVMIPELFDQFPDEDLPWAVVLRKVQNGSKMNISTLNVPDEGTRVVVMFDKGDVYSPLVVGELIGTNSKFDKTSGQVFG
jgi:hypothetical protein